uniref:Uncharacterized protein n=1 Tax=Bracon brevicornis TaxID=1563983 RepID=A0A6V7LEF5_9HYME
MDEGWNFGVKSVFTVKQKSVYYSLPSYSYLATFDALPLHHLRLLTTALGVEILNPSFEAAVIHEEGTEERTLRCNQWIFAKRSAKITLYNGEELELICEDGMCEVIETNEGILWAGAPDFMIDHPFMIEAFSYYKDFGEG